MEVTRQTAQTNIQTKQSQNPEKSLFYKFIKFIKFVGQLLVLLLPSHPYRYTFGLASPSIYLLAQPLPVTIKQFNSN